LAGRLKALHEAITVFSEADIRALVSLKPETLTDLRLWTMIQLLLDTGLSVF